MFQKNPFPIDKFVNLLNISLAPYIRYDVFQTNSIYGQGGIGRLPDTVVLVGWLGG